MSPQAPHYVSPLRPEGAPAPTVADRGSPPRSSADSHLERTRVGGEPPVVRPTKPTLEPDAAPSP